MKTKSILALFTILICFASCTGIKSIDKRRYSNGFFIQRGQDGNKTDVRTTTTESAGMQQPKAQMESVKTPWQHQLDSVILQQEENIRNSPLVKLNRKIKEQQSRINDRVTSALTRRIAKKDRTAGALFVIFALCTLFALLLYAGIAATMRSSMNAFGKVFLLILLWICFGACALEALIALVLAIVKLSSGGN